MSSLYCIILFLYHDDINYLLSLYVLFHSSIRFCPRYLCVVVHHVVAHVVAHAQFTCAFAGEYCSSYSFPRGLSPSLLYCDFLRPAGLQHFPPDLYFNLLPMILYGDPFLRYIPYDDPNFPNSLPELQVYFACLCREGGRRSFPWQFCSWCLGRSIHPRYLNCLTWSTSFASI